MQYVTFDFISTWNSIAMQHILGATGKNLNMGYILDGVMELYSFSGMSIVLWLCKITFVLEEVCHSI